MWHSCGVVPIPGAMHVATIRRRHGDRVYESHLVRRSIREGKRVRHETIANVSRLPPAAIEALRRALRGEALMAAGEAFAIEDPWRMVTSRRFWGRRGGWGWRGCWTARRHASAIWRWR